LTSPCRCVFPDELYTPSAKSSVYTDGNIPLVYTDGITDGINPSVYIDRFWDGIISVGINYRRKYSVGNSVAFLRFSGSAHTSTNPTGPKVNDHVSIQWPSMSNHRARTWDHRGSKPLGPKLLPLGHHLDGWECQYLVLKNLTHSWKENM